MRISGFIILLCLISCCTVAQQDGNSHASAQDDSTQAKPDFAAEVSTHCWNNGEDSLALQVVRTHQVYEEGWNLLAQPNFWKKVIALTPDSAVFNVAATRKVLETWSLEEWDKKTDEEKTAYRDSLRLRHDLDSNTRIFLTSGKQDYYKIDQVLTSIDTAVQVFLDKETDPWYAQAILLIESPGKLQKSSVGAYGPFQLMKGVARNFGLTVNNTLDERRNLTKSAEGASRLIREVCVPEAKAMLDALNLTYNETDLWFRLVVLHTYHAGALNVKAVLNKINPQRGDMDLIRTMWQTSYRNFRNASQNYSQIALASLMLMDQKLGIDPFVDEDRVQFIAPAAPNLD